VHMRRSDCTASLSSTSNSVYENLIRRMKSSPNKPGLKAGILVTELISYSRINLKGREATCDKF
jgi:hypothetical protein